MADDGEDNRAAMKTKSLQNCLSTLTERYEKDVSYFIYDSEDIIKLPSAALLSKIFFMIILFYLPLCENTEYGYCVPVLLSSSQSVPARCDSTVGGIEWHHYTR